MSLITWSSEHPKTAGILGVAILASVLAGGFAALPFLAAGSLLLKGAAAVIGIGAVGIDVLCLLVPAGNMCRRSHKEKKAEKIAAEEVVNAVEEHPGNPLWVRGEVEVQYNESAEERDFRKQGTRPLKARTRNCWGSCFSFFTRCYSDTALPDSSPSPSPRR